MWLNRLNAARHQRRSRGSGFTLIEVLIALLVLATGLIVMANFQGRVATSSIDAKARSEAMQLAQQRMEWLRARDLVELGSGTTVDAPIEIDGRVAKYDLSWALEDDPERAATVRVDWISSRDEPQSVELVTYLAADAYAGSLNPGSGVEFSGGSVAGPGGGARIKQYDPNALPEGREVEFGNVDKLDPNELGNIEFINRETGEAIEILTPHRAAYIAGAVYVRTDQNVGRVSGNDLSQDVFVRATPISLCGYDATETGGNFEYYPYRCYLAASEPGDLERKTFGWYGNVGILHPAATNQDGVCVGSLTPATALPASVRQYRGYETRDEVCEAGTTDCGKVVDGDGAPLLFPVGITGVDSGIRGIEDHNFLVARIGNNPSATACAESMEGAPPVDLAPFNANPPEFFCFSDDPALCPDREFGVPGPAGCEAVGAVCDAAGESYHGMVYAGASVDFHFFTSQGDEAEQTWDSSATTCAAKDGGKGWFLGGVRQVHDLLHLNYAAFRDRPEGVLQEDWAQPLAPENYWTSDEQPNAKKGYFVDIVSGAPPEGEPESSNKNKTYLSRCLFTAPR